MNEKPGDIPEEVWEQNRKIIEEIELEQKEYYESVLKDNPPEPPWIKYPDWERANMFWRMGKGEDYLNEEVGLYLQYASLEMLTKYKETYPEPSNWSGWYGNS